MQPRQPLAVPKSGKDLLNMYFLDLRCHLLEAAAALDRIERATGGPEALEDPRVKKLLAALEVLREPGADRAERFLNLFSEK